MGASPWALSLHAHMVAFEDVRLPLLMAQEGSKRVAACHCGQCIPTGMLQGAQGECNIGEHQACVCRLLDFSVVDKAGEQQPLESHGVRQTELFLSGGGSALQALLQAGCLLDISMVGTTFLCCQGDRQHGAPCNMKYSGDS